MRWMNTSIGRKPEVVDGKAGITGEKYTRLKEIIGLIEWTSATDTHAKRFNLIKSVTLS